MTQTLRAQPTPINHSLNRSASPQHLTLLDHLHELRTRLFWIVLALIAAASFGCLIQNQIMAVVMGPLHGQHLVYLTPIGGFNFLFRVSLYFGIVLILPVIIYHLFRFLEPVMKRRRSIMLYCLASLLLAVGGGSFAYFGTLPAALHFLTSFGIKNVSAMLTVDSYLSFVVTYVLGFAALFQIPLLLLIINTIKPLPPKKLMGFERYVVLAAFILAAIISPTPDVTNQTILAIPIILMYQVGVLLVWLQARARHKRAPGLAPVRTVSSAPPPIIRRQAATVVSAPVTQPKPVVVATSPIQPKRQPARPVLDIAPARTTATRGTPRPPARLNTPANHSVRPMMPRPAQQPRRVNSIDGMVARVQRLPQAS